jgi:hypothetical protein
MPSLPRLRALAVALLGALVTVNAWAEPPVRSLGYAYDLSSGRFLYTEVHDRTFNDGKLARQAVRYVLPDGRELGRKTLDYTRSQFVPVYRLEQDGYVEGINDGGDAFTLTRQRARGGTDTQDIAKEGALAADAGLLHLLQANFNALEGGKTITFRVLAPSRLDSYKFKARKIADTTFEGKPASRVQVDMDSMLKMFAGPLIFTFDAERHLREFRGPTNVRDPATGKEFTVRLAFYSTPPKEAPEVRD